VARAHGLNANVVFHCIRMTNRMVDGERGTG
jgi:hypothetical protein